MPRKKGGDFLPLSDDHKANVRAGIRASPFINTWLPDEEKTAASLYGRAVSASIVAETINRLYNRGRTAQSVSGHMSRMGVRWGQDLEPDEIAADAVVARRIRQGWGVTKRAADAALQDGDDERHVYHPLKDNARLLEILAR